MIEKLPKALNVLICGALVMQLAGCGTLLYPERKGQKGGRVDVGVALLDGIGLFFFLIPGIIAYAVDFSNGTIYLPGTMSSVDTNDLKTVKFDPKTATHDSIEEIILKETGHKVSFEQTNLEIVKLKSNNDIYVAFNKALPEINDAKTASLK